eukprot:CAMPEP_0171804450 /NCGR_PEP_ID=MMETSP0991-20121206/74103_1 /TAXON_ID=483369 /ORGANISM="non described non described, Strain CCMP2098" /LENGTH=70 /DNA_ID=CAMNT_0012416795 /DNA_START=52 /DNA_END=260 /DNA_ORIENTATION=+
MREHTARASENMENTITLRRGTGEEEDAEEDEDCDGTAAVSGARVKIASKAASLDPHRIAITLLLLLLLL